MSETGHAKNIEHFEQAIAYATSWGAAYQPTNASLDLVRMNLVLNSAKTAMSDAAGVRAAYTTAVNDRETTFQGIRPLITRCVQYYESTGAAQNKIDDVRTLKRKLDGSRAKSIEAPADPPAGGTPPTPPATISASQQSYTQVVEHLTGIIELLSDDTPQYDPNETEMKLTTLTTRRDDMAAANTNVINTQVPYSNALGARNDILYADGSGLVDIALAFKKYVRAAFGAGSTQYNQIKDLEFVRPRSHYATFPDKTTAASTRTRPFFPSEIRPIRYNSV
jgi:hypothetical protein